MDELPYIRVREDGNHADAYDMVGTLKCSRGTREHQNNFLLTRISCKKRDDGSWYTDFIYTYNADGWDEELYNQAYPRLTLWQKTRRWFFCNG